MAVTKRLRKKRTVDIIPHQKQKRKTLKKKGKNIMAKNPAQLGESFKVRLTLTEDLLGTMSNNSEIYADYIASKSPDADIMEQEVMDFDPSHALEKAMTIFPRLEDGTPFLYDYQLKGFLKDTAGVLRKVTGTQSSKIKAYKKEIDGLVFVEPRKIPINVVGEMDVCQRPLRASTPMGERVALAASESIPAGSTIEFEIIAFTDQLEAMVHECLAFGIRRGLGQWRNSGKGRFTVEYID